MAKQITCPTCNGTGKTKQPLHYKPHVCKTCSGKGKLEVEELKLNG